MSDNPNDVNITPSWATKSIIYQIYPRSFADSNGDGVGDLAGITSKLDYLADLGVDAIWLSPIYTSPMADFGYDVADYRGIDRLFGSLADFDNLLTEAHARKIKVLMDLVPNHTSIQHEWFIQARATRNNEYRDWYIWRAPKPDGSAPNDWQSIFGGPAWAFDPATNQYYFHSFLKEQPDLNWENPVVRQAIGNIMRYWYDLGVDGFRVDAILSMYKDSVVLDSPDVAEGLEAAAKKELMYNYGISPNLAEYLKVMTDVTQDYPGCYLFFEAWAGDNTAEGYAGLYKGFDNTVAASFNFGLLTAGEGWDPAKFWTAGRFKEYIGAFEHALPADSNPAYVLGNHDRSRIATQIGGEAARAAAMLLLTLPGARFIYYGEELGMKDVEIPEDLRVDPSPVSRDPERTPMQWQAQPPNNGFSTGKPWLPLAPDAAQVNTETLGQDKSSILNLYRELIKLVKSEPAFEALSYRLAGSGQESVYGFERVNGEHKALVLINFSDAEMICQISSQYQSVGLSTQLDKAGQSIDDGRVVLRPHEGLILLSSAAKAR